jgi:hypothetical protein
MFTVELYADTNAMTVHGLSGREATKFRAVHGNTIWKMLQFSVSSPSGLV